ncbi:MAG: hypothetical protein GYB68_13435 [Chloroflexi bacterium]|nr:hypothetical protein [Chloroflexota bacterium]
MSDYAFPFDLEAALREAFGDWLIPSSLTIHDGAAYWLEGHPDGSQQVGLLSADPAQLDQFQGEAVPFRDGFLVKHAAATEGSARALRNALPWLKPVPLGLATSFGFGDRLGLATPGHVQAIQAIREQYPDADIWPVFAQQSTRELGRTRRKWGEVMTAASFGAFEAGWQAGLGADAHRLRSPEDLNAALNAGFTTFTLDTNDHVDTAAELDDLKTIAFKLMRIDWETLNRTQADIEREYLNKEIDTGFMVIRFDRELIVRTIVKLGNAITHIVRMVRHLQESGQPFEIAIAVDESERPLRHAEHVFLARELIRLNVDWVGIAPRFVGTFEKAIEYKGDLRHLERDLRGHAAIAQTYGPYKLRLQSGSDKFELYSLLADVSEGLLHVATSGTSYLEALRVVAAAHPDLMREIGALVRGRYGYDRRAYIVSGQVDQMPPMASLTDDQLPTLLDHPNTRQILHVTYGSVLDAFGDDLLETLRRHHADYTEGLRSHFVRHLSALLD